ncbi:MAG TPA: hypothetical protein VLJ21_02780 [Candidatus Binatia bacterium]|nr:hypothetical protein [Candidatus Binatia bacterium]
MDAATAERINNLAKNLKDLHLAASMEEAFSKAREIILGNQGSGKPIRELVDSEQRIVETAMQESEIVSEAKTLERDVSTVKESNTKDELNNAELAQEASKASEQLQKHQKELEKIRSEIEAAKRALDEAKQVKDRFERQTPDMTPPAQKPRSQLSEEDKKKSDLSRIFNFGKR